MKHELLEKNVILLAICILVTVSIGGLVQIVPLYTIENTIEKVDGMRPYAPLELAGANIYIREGCYLCHSQMIRPFRDEAERYGHYSLAAESMYDHPFQWGSKRTGPDLARIGGKYSNDWHAAHLINPRNVVPESVMPPYAFLARKELAFNDVAEHLKTLRAVGVPYTDQQIDEAAHDLKAQAGGDEDGAKELMARYPKAPIGDFDGDPTRLTELDAVIAYLQMRGVLIDFTTFDPEQAKR
ncbi:MAG: cytochrome-c oxidase, cbb3-type subunit II [Rhodospirillales bacterium RIFCSPLOWO2_12_FULL_58_28]|nr:MAG: cytochrome-c oxidase, cbb3-type subunit II [Rhodospirillales bacterium RIFCSPLOWO2_02_FULL_58_16]OHC76797.1 MAG: cytochrome-c oxidase, cbb3-type subunit II [Rhodospirillales bacterium RIFCSPLOWO2_12_FULL_58_28]